MDLGETPRAGLTACARDCINHLPTARRENQGAFGLPKYSGRGSGAVPRVLCPITPRLEASWAARGGLGWQRCFKERAAVQEGPPQLAVEGGLFRSQ